MWRQYGGKQNYTTQNDITTNTLICNNFTLINSYDGTFNVNGSIIVSQGISVGGSAIIGGNIDVSGNINASNLNIASATILGDVSMNGNLVVDKNATIEQDLYLYDYLYLGPDSASFLYGTQFSQEIGVNTDNPQATFDINGNQTQVLNVYSNQPTNRNIIAQNVNQHGIAVQATDSASTIQFYEENTVNQPTQPNAQIQYLSGGYLEFDVSTNTQIYSAVSISPQSGQNTHIDGETAVIYDTSDGTYLYTIYENNSENTGNALSLITTDTSSVTFMNIITPNKTGLSIGGGAYPNDQTRSLGTLGWTDASDNYIPAQNIVSGNSTVKYQSTTGFNTYAPRTESYVVDINGPVHITNGTVKQVISTDIQIYVTSFSRTSPLVGISVGSPSTTAYPYIPISYFTSDGGQTWNSSIIGTGTVQASPLIFNACYTFDASYAFIGASSGGFIYYTFNSGQTWNIISGDIISTVRFTSLYVMSGPNAGYNRVFFTGTGPHASGLSYFDIPNNTTDSPFNITISATTAITHMVTFVNGDGTNLYICGQDSNGHDIIAKYSDDLIQLILYQPSTHYNYTYISVLNASYIAMVGTGRILYTHDGGSTWTTAISSYYLNAIYLLDTMNAVAVANYGEIWYSTDGYITWQPIPTDLLNSSGNSNNVTSSTYNLQTITMIDINTLMISAITQPYISGSQLGESLQIYVFIPNLFNSVNNSVLDVSGCITVSTNIHINNDAYVTNTLFSGNAYVTNTLFSGTISGNTLVLQISELGLNIDAVTSYSDGTIQATNGLSYEIPSSFGIYYNLINTSVAGSYSRITCSSDGSTILLAGTNTALINCYDYGAPSSQNTSSLTNITPTGLSISANGQIVLVVDSQNNAVWISTNYGYANQLGPGTFVQPAVFLSGYTYQGGCISATGIYMFVQVNQTSLYISSNSGTTWNIVTVRWSGSSPTNYICCSASGQYVYYSDGTVFYYSSNYGQSFSFDNWGGVFGICCSSSGQYVYSCSQYNIFYSQNHGNTFISSVYIPNIISICCSSTGRYVYALTASNGFYISTNFGSSFTNTSFSGTSYACCMSSNGEYVYVSNSAGLYMFQLGSNASVFETTTIFGSSPATALGTGALQVNAGGASIAGDTYIGGNTSITGNTYILDSSPATALGTGALQVNAGGASIAGDTYIGGNTSITGNTYILDSSPATALGTGALQVNAGGASIAGNTYIGGNTYIENTLAVTQTSALGLNINAVTSYSDGTIQATNGLSNENPSSFGIYYNLINTSVAGAYSRITCSSDGSTILLAGTSTALINCYDYGAPSSQNTSPQLTNITPTGLSISANGQIVLVVDSQNNAVWISTNYGYANQLGPGTFVQQAIFLSSYTYQGGCISATGIYMFVQVNQTSLYISSNSGTTWNIITVPWSGSSPTNYICCSASGQYVYYSDGTNFYYSSNYGQSFSSSWGGGLYGICCSSSGQYVYFAVNGGNGVIYSHNYGTSLSNFGFGPVVVYVCCSSNGRYVCALTASNGLFVSTHFGITYTNTSLSGTSYACCISSNGEYLYVSNSIGLYIFQLGSGGSLNISGNTLAISQTSALGLNINAVTSYSDGTIQATNGLSYEIPSSFGIYYNLINTSVTGSYSQITCSSDGSTILLAGTNTALINCYDYGAPASQNTSPQLTNITPTGLSISSNGQIVLVVDSQNNAVWISTNYGYANKLGPGTFVQQAVFLSSYTYQGGCISATGIYMFVQVNQTSLYISSNSGTTWNIVTVPWSGSSLTNYICCSASGQYIYYSDGTNFYYSLNYGQSFSSSWGGGVYGICCSSSGQHVYFAINNTHGVIYSHNYGVSLSNFSFTQVVVYVCCSSNGRYVFALTASNGIFASTNFGTTYTNTSLSGTSYACCMSSNGEYVYVSNSAGLYVFQLGSNASVFETATIFGSSSATALGTGALQVNAGGASISGNTYIGGNTVVIGNITAGYATNPNAGYVLDVNGSARSSAWYATSDYRIKENVQLLSEQYSVDNLYPKYYFNTQSNQHDIGFIAHEVQEYYPFLVHGEKDGSHNQTLNYNGLIGILVKDIKQCKREIADLKAQLNR